jgi:hypothetical protein
MTRPAGAPTPPAYLARLRARCPACGHTVAWHVVDGRCAYRTAAERKGGCVAAEQSATWCGCAVQFPVPRV